MISDHNTTLKRSREALAYRLFFLYSFSSIFYNLSYKLKKNTDNEPKTDGFNHIRGQEKELKKG